MMQRCCFADKFHGYFTFNKDRVLSLITREREREQEEEKKAYN